MSAFIIMSSPIAEISMFVNSLRNKRSESPSVLRSAMVLVVDLMMALAVGLVIVSRTLVISG